MLKPSLIHYNIVESHSELMLVFKKNISAFFFLNVNEDFASENMSIRCLIRDVYDDTDSGESYYTFWWNHFQKSENHFIKLSKVDNQISIWFESSVYKITDKTHQELLITPPLELYEAYQSLYYANQWFQQLNITLNEIIEDKK